jgi:alcohol dehydrogenase, propanol-preferring
VGNQRDALEVLDMAGRGVVKTHVQIMKMEELTEVFNEMSQGRSK